MKAIILAAGMGTRLGKYTQNLPKGMLNFLGKTLIQRQIDVLRECGISNIIIVKGYNAEKINFTNVKEYINPLFSTTNMVTTLMCAREEFDTYDEEILVCYSDIIFEKRLIETLMQSKADVNVLVDDDWMPYWKARSEDWMLDIESLQYDSKNNIFDIGNTKCSLSEAMSRYIGLILFSKKGVFNLVNSFDTNKRLYWDKDILWRNSKSFKKAYMTCMLQELIATGVAVQAVHVSRGWMEFDTVEDYEKAISWFFDGTLLQFIDLQCSVKRIGITQRVMQGKDFSPRDALEHDYISYFQKWGVVLIPIPNVYDTSSLIIKELHLDGIILSGGNNINPSLYNSSLVVDDVSESRDSTEKAIIDYCIKHHLPILAICRGLQFLNVYFGGKLRPITNHVRVHHTITFNSEVAELLGVTSSDVNSFHNFGLHLEDVASALRVFAISKDNNVEGIYHPDFPFVGIMWHPERSSSDNELNYRIVNAFFKRELLWK